MPNPVRSNALTIAGCDPTGGAGVELDLQVFALHDVHGMAVSTALTVQTTLGVHRVHPSFPEVAGQQLSLLLEDVRPGALKTGMLSTDDVLIRIANVLDRHSIPRVVDPILQASDGSYLLERRAWGNLVDLLIRGATLVTPNLPEAEALTGENDAERAAAALREAGALNVLVTGGHAESGARDYLLTSAGGTWIEGERLDTPPVHGTGCALSAAITAHLAKGEALEPAVRRAKRFVEHAIAAAWQAGKGAPLLGLSPPPPNS